MTPAAASGLQGGLDIRWRPLAGQGIEHLTLSLTAQGLRADAVLVGEHDGRPYGASYAILLDDAFCVLAFTITATNGSGLSLARRAGRWLDVEGRHLPGFDECIDIDLTGTPFTNTLPIRRESWEIGQRRSFTMLFVPFDSFEPVVAEQAYTCLAPRLFRFETADGSFTADLPLDEHGLVLDYPHLFERC